MKQIIKDALILFAITLIAGLLLGGVYEITKKPIAEQSRIKKEKAYKAVFEKYYRLTMSDGADSEDEKAANEAEVAEIVASLSFEPWSDEELATIKDSFTSKLKDNTANTLDSVVTAYQGGNELLGYVITVTNGEGYGGDIQISVGVLADGTVAGVEILSIGETPGLGMNAQNDSFLNKFSGVTTDGFTYTKTGSTRPDEIDAISSATYTTKSMTNGVNAALAAYAAIMDKGGAK